MITSQPCDIIFNMVITTLVWFGFTMCTILNNSNYTKTRHYYSMHAHMYMHTLRVCPYLNIRHNDEVHSSSLYVLRSAAVQGLRNWDYPVLGEVSQDVVLVIYLRNDIYRTQCLTCTVPYNMHEVMCVYMWDICIIMHAIYNYMYAKFTTQHFILTVHKHAYTLRIL